MSPARSLRVALLLAAFVALCAAAACSQDGVTTNCPAQPLYQTYPLGDASVPDALSGDSATVTDAHTAAVQAGCATGVNGVGAPAAGSTGSGGSSGHGGSGGKSGTFGKSGSGGQSSSGGEGGTVADNAGAAGRN